MKKQWNNPKFSGVDTKRDCPSTRHKYQPRVSRKGKRLALEGRTLSKGADGKWKIDGKGFNL